MESEVIHEEEVLRYSKILEGVSDIIGVYNTDNTIMFYNKAGYDFFKKRYDEVKGKKCYEMFNRNQKCPNCLCEKAIETKRIIRVEKYIPEINKYIECSYNPVLNDLGEVVFVVEQLRDITDKKILENVLKESEERYRKIVDISPDAIIITVDGEIVLANKEALKYVNNLVGKSIYKYAPDFAKILNKRINQILKNKTEKAVFDYKVVLDDNKVIDVEVSSSYLVYNGKSAILSIMRDITERKRELYSAAKMQKQLLKKPFSLPDKANMRTLYVPAKTVSGDFFYTCKVDENLIIGIIGDVSGKGVTAALNISAFNVLFHEAVLVSSDLYDIVNNLNKKVVDYLGERYVAACCFSFDFNKNKAHMIGAGINQFVYVNKNDEIEEKIVKGPFLGMFEDSKFDEQIINFKSGDKFYFYTDGLDFIFDDKTKKNYIKKLTIDELKNYIKAHLDNMLTDVNGIKDDCTLLALEIK
ncbi:SpoIIE family protein phosphatase [Tepidibacter thalassicus]|uniref:PAS domain S-box-containing protein n=1 Tax=Tepidibacter thalassicus DSM 15285 TaxID=1123350 RepID=A0A1M5PLA3_9FIRM|nr:SpoIIE family protein phosphatase [Tepidibacter thalassicus]SHH02554.1 PAS domain S-box-containing protein [Tepidibacter thalassicus DSM 15285]